VTWRPEGEHESQVDQAASMMLQGSIFELPVFIWLARDGLPLTQASYDDMRDNGQIPGQIRILSGDFNGDIEVDTDAQEGEAAPINRAMIITQSCELARIRSSDKAPLRPFVTVVPVYQEETTKRKTEARGSKPHILDVPWHTTQAIAGKTWIADLSLATTLERSLLVDAIECGHPKNQERRTLSDALSRYFGRPALPDWAQEYFEPVSKEIRRRTGKKSELGEILKEHLRGIRISCVPDFDLPGPHALTVLMVPNWQWELPDRDVWSGQVGSIKPSPPPLDQASKTLLRVLDRPASSTNDERCKAWCDFTEALFMTCVYHPEVTGVEFALRPTLTPEEFRYSEELDFSYLSV
jgi:hypothetical protein